MNDLLNWLAENYGLVIALLYALVNLLNAAFTSDRARKVFGTLADLLDRVSVLSAKDKADTLKLPGQPSKEQEPNKEENS